MVQSLLRLNSIATLILRHVDSFSVLRRTQYTFYSLGRLVSSGYQLSRYLVGYNVHNAVISSAQTPPVGNAPPERSFAGFAAATCRSWGDSPTHAHLHALGQ